MAAPGAVNGASRVSGTRQRIIDVAMRLFSEGGYRGVSMSDIASQLGITKATLYHHFRGKSDIYQEVLEDVLTRLDAEVSRALAAADAQDRLRETVTNYVAFGLREKSLVNIVITRLPKDEPAIREQVVHFREGLHRRLEPVVAENLDEERVAAAEDVRFLTSVLLWMMDGLLVETVLLNGTVDAPEIADRIIAVLRDLGAPPESELGSQFSS